MKNIENIIFDLGGVIIDIDYQRTVDAFDKIAFYNSRKYYFKDKQHFLFDQFEIGKISPEVFRDEIRNLLKIKAKNDVIDNAWNALLLDISPERITLIKKLSIKKRIFLLSNTNAIHKIYFDKKMKDNFGMENLDSLFEKSYYSHLVEDRKPNLSIFQKVLEENKLTAERTLFIDDSIQHIEAASKLRIKTLHLKDFKFLNFKKIK